MGKDKLRRFAEMVHFPNVIQPELKEVLNANHSLKGNWNDKVFKRKAPIVLELGCGKGEYTVGLAKAYPEKNFMGIDIKGARMWRGAKEAIEDGLNNVVFLRTRIEFITSFFAAQEVDEIWITFPDPQLKDGRIRKRLTHPLFLNRYKQFLKAGGHINLKTDSRELYDFSVETLNKEGYTINCMSTDVYNEKEVNPLFPEHLTDIHTFYEQRYLEEKKNICYLQFVLDGDQTDISKEYRFF